MKKQAKKLTLAKETVRNLEELTLRRAAGGSPTEDQFWSCRVCDADPTINLSGCGGVC
jgi:hypothetical protein